VAAAVIDLMDAHPRTWRNIVGLIDWSALA
jgi:hypothetical protein